MLEMVDRERGTKNRVARIPSRDNSRLELAYRWQRIRAAVIR